MGILTFLVVAIVVLIVVSLLAQIFGVGNLFANLTPTQRTLVALLGLVFIVIVLYLFFTRYMPL